MYMKIVKLIVLFSCLALFLYLSELLYAQQKSQDIEVSATVGDFTVNISGFISPGATVKLSSNQVFLAEVVADENGSFLFPNILIQKDTQQLCLTAIDVRKLGQSFTCFSSASITGNANLKDVFLPPTISLSTSEITQGSFAIASGYTMPNAQVNIQLGENIIFTAIADSKGYYEFMIKDLAPGKYNLFTSARYNGKKSLFPTKTLEFRTLSPAEKAIQVGKDKYKKALDTLQSLGLSTILLLVPLFMLVIILSFYLWSKRFVFITKSRYLSKLFQSKIPQKKYLHHFWFVGY